MCSSDPLLQEANHQVCPATSLAITTMHLKPSGLRMQKTNSQEYDKQIMKTMLAVTNRVVTCVDLLKLSDRLMLD